MNQTWWQRLTGAAKARPATAGPKDTVTLELSVSELRDLEQAASVLLAVAELADRRDDARSKRYPAELRDYAATVHIITQRSDQASAAGWFRPSSAEHRSELARHLRDPVERGAAPKATPVPMGHDELGERPTRLSEERLGELVASHLGVSTAELAAAIGAEDVDAFAEHISRIARSAGVGQDEEGCWWTAEARPQLLQQLMRTGRTTLPRD